MAEVFLSYASVDVAEAERVATVLERSGYSVWWDRHLLSGERFNVSIQRELNAARAVLVLWTKSAVESEWVYSEARRANQRGVLLQLRSRDLPIDDLPAPFDALHCPFLDDEEALRRSVSGLVKGGPEAPVRRGIRGRRLVTVLAVEVGTTGADDPEETEAWLTPHQDRCREILREYGGTSLRAAGEVMVGVFGAPTAHEDDAERAVRSALEMVYEVAGDDPGGASPSWIHVGVATGDAMISTRDDPAADLEVSGEVLSASLRLAQSAGTGEVLIGARTHALLPAVLESEEREVVGVQGPAFRVQSAAPAGFALGARSDTTLIGRAREARALDEAFARAVETDGGHLVLVLGPAGIGKTALVTDFLDRVEESARVLQGRCVSYGKGITYWPVVQLIRGAAGLDGSEPAGATSEALETLLLGSDERAEAARVLLPLLGQGGEPGSSDETVWAINLVLEQVALQGPVVLCIDDLHWAETTLLDLLDRVRDETRDLPVLMVCTARPDFLERHPGWAHGSLNATTFSLEPFGFADIGASLASNLGGGLPDEAVATIARLSGGNPLFVEQIGEHLVETGRLSRVDGAWSLAGKLDEAGVPASLSALLAARLDQLPEGERSLLERASVIGLEFTSSQAEQLAVGEANGTVAMLQALVRRDLLRKVRGRDRDTWAFRHIIVRDAAYDSLPKSDRAALHVTVADYLATHDREAGAEQTSFIAHHLVQAGRYLARLAPKNSTTVEVAERAVTASITAAQEARAREDLDAAVALLQDASGLRPTPRTRLELLVWLQQLLYSQYNYSALVPALDAYDQVAETLDPATELDKLHGLLWRTAAGMMMSRVNPSEVLELAVRVRELAQKSADVHREVMALYCVIDAWAELAQWHQLAEPVEALASLGDAQDRREVSLWRASIGLYASGPLSALDEWAVKELEQSRSPQHILRCRLIHALTEAASGDANAGLLVDSAAETVPNERSESINSMLLGVAYLFGGRRDEAIKTFQGLIKLHLDGNDYSHASTYLAWVACLRLERGDRDLSEISAALEEVERLASAYDVTSLAFTAAGRAVVASRRNADEQALALANSAIATIDRGSEPWAQADIRRWVSEVPRAMGDGQLERAWLIEALTRYDIKGITTWRAEIARRLEDLE